MGRNLLNWMNVVCSREPRERHWVRTRLFRPASVTTSSKFAEGSSPPFASAKRWSAVSDGGEDQGAEEVTVHGAKRESSCQFWKEPSRASGSSFSARDSSRDGWQLDSVSIHEHSIRETIWLSLPLTAGTWRLSPPPAASWAPAATPTTLAPLQRRLFRDGCSETRVCNTSTVLVKFGPQEST